MNVLENQIKNQIERKILIKVKFKNINKEYISLYEQNNNYFLEPAFCVAKKIKKEIYDEIIDMCEYEQSELAVNQIETNLTYDEFFAKYYNNL